MADYAERRAQLVARLQEDAHLRDARVAAAMLDVPREQFLPEGVRARAYEDAPLPIGLGQTMSAPHMVAIMCEALLLEPGHRVLEVGTGSGYHAAVTARLVGATGSVVTIERVPELARAARARLRESGANNVEVLEGDGSRGAPERAPFDRIYVTAAAPAIPPPHLEQLAPDGVWLGPVGRRPSRLVRVRRARDDYAREDLGACEFVPLVGEFGDALEN